MALNAPSAIGIIRRSTAPVIVVRECPRRPYDKQRRLTDGAAQPSRAPAGAGSAAPSRGPAGDQWPSCEGRWRASVSRRSPSFRATRSTLDEPADEHASRLDRDRERGDPLGQELRLPVHRHVGDRLAHATRLREQGRSGGSSVVPVSRRASRAVPPSGTATGTLVSGCARLARRKRRTGSGRSSRRCWRRTRRNDPKRLRRTVPTDGCCLAPQPS